MASMGIHIFIFLFGLKPASWIPCTNGPDRGFRSRPQMSICFEWFFCLGGWKQPYVVLSRCQSLAGHHQFQTFSIQGSTLSPWYDFFVPPRPANEPPRNKVILKHLFELTVHFPSFYIFLSNGKRPSFTQWFARLRYVIRKSHKIIISQVLPFLKLTKKEPKFNKFFSGS